MKKYLALTPIFLLGLFVLPHLAFAYTGTQLSGSVSSNQLVATSLDGACTTAGASVSMVDDTPDPGWGAVHNFGMSYPGTYNVVPFVGSHSPSRGGVNFLLDCIGTGSFTDPEYYISFSVTGGVLTVNNPTGPPAPSPTNPTATQVIRITAPGLYASTTNPFDIDFDAYVSTAASTTDGYQIVLTQDNTGISTTYYQLLTPGFPLDTPFRDATTSVSVPGTGAYTLTLMLGGGTADKIANPSLPWYGNGWVTATHFGIGAYNSTLNYTTQPLPDSSAYSSSDCSINFLGSFNLPNCIGYLIVPASTTMQDFSSLTLAHSFPFSYAYDMNRVRTELFSASSTASTSIGMSYPNFGCSPHPCVGTITFISSAMIAAVPFSNTIRLVLVGLIWLMAAEFIYYTVLRSHNDNTGV